MWPTTLTQLAGFIGAIAGIVFAFLQGWRWYLDTLEKKAKLKADIEIAKHNAETARYNAELLTASQVAELLRATQEVKDDIAQIKSENEDRNEQLTRAMDKLENNLKNFEDTFQKFLVARLNQFEQTLIK